MNNKILHITALILLATFTMTVAGINIYYHTCGVSGETTASLEKSLCACETENAETTTTKTCCSHDEDHYAVKVSSSEKCCDDELKSIAIDSDFLFSLKKDELASPNVQVDKKQDNLFNFEKYDTEIKTYSQKIKDIPKKILKFIIINYLQSLKDSDPDDSM